jgi:hypothetical protein
LAYLLWGNRLLAGFVKLFNRLLVVTQILLTSDEDDWKTAAEVKDFGYPLLVEHVSAVFLSRGLSGMDPVGSYLLLDVVKGIR